jgi:capsular polysaccharide transport system permease protein
MFNFNSFSIQHRVIGALLMREIITRYGRRNIGFLWLFIEPMLFTLGLVFLRNMIFGRSYGGLPLEGFLLTGYSVLMLFRNIVSKLKSSIGANQGLLYHHNVRVMDLFYARFLLECAGATCSFIVLTFLFQYLGLIQWPVNLSKVIFAWLLLAWFSFGLALIVAYLSETSQLFERLWPILFLMILPFSGIVYQVSWMPTEIQTVLLWSPLVNGVELLREGYFGNQVQAMYSIAYLIFINLLITLMGLVLIRKIRGHLEGE